MMITKYAITVGLIMVGLFSFSQTKLPSLTVNDIDKSTAFTALVELLADSDYFIQNMEKDAGFIQVKSVIKKRGLFAKKAGNRIVYNVFLTALDGNKVRIHLQANLEISDRTEDGYYYRDEGVSEEPKDYEDLLTLFESHFENQ